ncbi:MAG: hypothetical protein CL685_02805 [Candidatus Magasanikbacteria bacterium]|nr:hypothetical protein [Candidatus Magasanikbacteria bacterium]
MLYSKAHFNQQAPLQGLVLQGHVDLRTMELQNTLFILFLVSLSGTFSSLTLAFFRLQKDTIRRKAELGDIISKRIFKLIQDPNHLLCTLIVGNISVNTLLSLYTESFLPSAAAFFVTATLTTLFGELVPSSYAAQNPKKLSRMLVWYVEYWTIILWLVAKPLAIFLTRLHHVMGVETQGELATIYSKPEFGEIISEHVASPDSKIDDLEGQIVIGALGFSEKKVVEIMTPINNVFCLDINTPLSESVLIAIRENGFTRIPVTDKADVCGILYAKDLIGIQANTPLRNVYRENSILSLSKNTRLDDAFQRLQKPDTPEKRTHIAFVFEEDSNELIGIITLEDIVEQIIQQDIVDESDIVTHSNSPRTYYNNLSIV